MTESEKAPCYFTVDQMITFPKMADEKNPEFTFNCTDTAILAMISTGQIDARSMAMKTLADRGLNECGQYVGMKQAKRIFESNVVQNIAI